jgi:glycosyltransferase involved in cell wall biosynthesis
MRILHVIPSIVSRQGGPTYALKAMTKELIRIGHDCTVVTTDFDLDAEASYGFEPEVVVHVFKSLDQKQYPLSFTLAWWMFQNVQKYDLVHVHSFFTSTALAGSVFAALSNVPYIIRPLGTLDPWSLEQKSTKKKAYLNIVGQRMLKGATGIHVTSSQEERNLRGFGLSLRLFNVPLGVALPVLKEKAAADEDILKLLFLSRIHPKKNLETLIRAVAKLVEQGEKIELRIAGGGEEDHVQAIHKMLGELNLKAIKLCGFVKGEAKENLLNWCDVFLLPSYQENFGVAVVEGMAYSKPVIISDEIALAEEVERREAGLVFPPDNEKLLMDRILQMKDATARQISGKNGRELVVEKYTLEGLGARLVVMYQGVLQ